MKVRLVNQRKLTWRVSPFREVLFQKYRRQVFDLRSILFSLLICEHDYSVIHFTEELGSFNLEAVGGHFYRLNPSVEYSKLDEVLYLGAWTIFSFPQPLDLDSLNDLLRRVVDSDNGQSRYSNSSQLFYIDSWHDNNDWEIGGSKLFISKVLNVLNDDLHT